MVCDDGQEGARFILCIISMKCINTQLIACCCMKGLLRSFSLSLRIFIHSMMGLLV